MRFEARFLGGPAEGEIRGIPDLAREIRVAHLPPMRWGAAPEDYQRVDVETHNYRPVRAVVYYEYEGKL